MADDALLDLPSIDPDELPAFGDEGEDGELDHGSPFDDAAAASKAPAKKKSPAKKAAAKPKDGER